MKTVQKLDRLQNENIGGSQKHYKNTTPVILSTIISSIIISIQDLNHIMKKQSVHVIIISFLMGGSGTPYYSTTLYQGIHSELFCLLLFIFCIKLLQCVVDGNLEVWIKIL